MKILRSRAIMFFGMLAVVNPVFAQLLKTNNTSSVENPAEVNWVTTTNATDTNVWDEAALFNITNPVTGQTHLWLLTTRVTNIPALSHQNSTLPPKASLQLIFNAENPETNDVGIRSHTDGGPHGYHGSIFYTTNWKIPIISKTNNVLIMASADDTRIVMAVEDAGLIYYTTNSGISWTVIHKSGQYWFRLSYSKKDNIGFFALATIFISASSEENRTVTNENWYAVSSEPGGNKLIMTGGGANPAPVLSISYFPNQVVVSWPASFTGFALQENFDLSTTNWVTLTNKPTLNFSNQQNQVTLSPTNSSGFYRLTTP